MSSINTKQIDGDVSVSRNAAIGGDVTVQGKSRFKGSVKIDGWLEAKNIKGAAKGLYTTIDKLKAAYPLPHDGWWAIVGTSLPGPIYVGHDKEWVPTGENGGSPTIDSEKNREDIEALQESVNSIISTIDSNYKYAGIATPLSVPKNDENVYYMASVPGTYKNFNSIIIDIGEIAIIQNYDGSWVKKSLNILDHILLFSPFTTASKTTYSRVKELYINGLNPSKRYYFSILRYYKEAELTQLYIYSFCNEDKSDKQLVGIFEQIGTYSGIAKISERNNSGINGYALIDIRSSDTENVTPEISIEKASNINYSPILYYSINPVSFSESAKKDSEGNIIVDTYLKKLIYSPFKSADDNAIKRIYKLYLTGLDKSKRYYFKFLRYYSDGNEYNVIQLHLYSFGQEDKSDEKKVASTEYKINSDFNGIISLNEYESSGVSGYAIVRFTLSDTVNTSPEIDIHKTSYDAIFSENSHFAERAGSIDIINTNLNESFGASTAQLNIIGGYFSNVSKLMYATFENSETKKGGLLRNITFKPYGSEIKFAIGFVDQRGLPVIRSVFNLSCTANTVNHLDISYLGISLNEGETIFVVFERTENCIYYNSHNENNQLQMIYGSESNPLHRLSNTYGGYIYLYWEIYSLESPFASKCDVQDIKDLSTTAIDLANKANSNIRIVNDRDGNPYKLMIIDGQLSAIPLNYSKVLVLCNSIGINGRLYSQGWCGYRGMASSRYGLDYRSHLENGLRKKNPNASVILKNIWNWEVDFNSISLSELLDDVLTSDIDCIVFRVGENVPTSRIPEFKENIISLMQYCFSKCKNADAYITSMVWDNVDKNNALMESATKLNLSYINVSASASEYKEKIGHYLEGDNTSDNGYSWDEETQVLYKITGSGIAGHTNDVGMLIIANAILTAMGYDSLNITHSITINNTNGYSCDIINDKWVENGIVNIISNGNNVSVETSDNESISVINHNDGVFTFIMPTKDVTITIN